MCAYAPKWTSSCSRKCSKSGSDQSHRCTWLTIFRSSYELALFLECPGIAIDLLGINEKTISLPKMIMSRRNMSFPVLEQLFKACYVGLIHAAGLSFITKIGSFFIRGDCFPICWPQISMPVVVAKAPRCLRETRVLPHWGMTTHKMNSFPWWITKRRNYGEADNNPSQRGSFFRTGAGYICLFMALLRPSIQPPRPASGHTCTPPFSTTFCMSLRGLPQSELMRGLSVFYHTIWQELHLLLCSQSDPRSLFSLELLVCF